MSSGSILSFRRPARRETYDWSQQELAEFYRVEAALLKAGLLVETDRGVTDEGDPWFVFCRVDDGDVVIHFARIDGEYVVAGLIQEEAARGRDFPALVSALIAAHPVARPERQGANVILHPATMLVALVGIALLKSGEVKASSAPEPTDDKAAAANVPGSGPFGGLINATATSFSAVIDSAHVAAIVAAAGFIASQINLSAPATDDAPAVASHQMDVSTFDVGHYLRAAQAAAGEAAGALDGQSIATTAQAALQAESVEPAPVTPVASGAAEGAGLSGADLLKLLSLVSILWTLPDIESARATGEISVEHAASLLGVTQPGPRGGRDSTESAQSVEGVATAKAAAAPHATGGPVDQPTKSVMVIDLAVSGADLPNVMAVKVAMAGAASGGLEEAHLVSHKELPSALLKIISAVDLSISATISTSLTMETADKGGGHQQILFPVGPSSLETGPTPVVEPISTQDKIITVANGSGVVHIVPATADASSVQKAVDAFMHEASDLKMFLSDRGVVFYDSNAVLSRPGDLTSETWTFSDGSSISLVGLGLHHTPDLV